MMVNIHRYKGLQEPVDACSVYFYLETLKLYCTASSEKLNIKYIFRLSVAGGKNDSAWVFEV